MLAFVHGDKACFDELFNRYRQPIYANTLIGGLRDAWELGLELLIWLFSILPSLLLSGAILFLPLRWGRRRWHAATRSVA